IITPLDAGRPRQGTQAVDHLADGDGRRIDRHHIPGAHDYELHILPERDVFRKADRFAVATAERSAARNGHEASPRWIYSYIRCAANSFKTWTKADPYCRRLPSGALPDRRQPREIGRQGGVEAGVRQMRRRIDLAAPGNSHDRRRPVE